MKRTHWMWMMMACLCLLGSTAVQAANFSGTVTDPDGFSTGRIEGATIMIEPGGYVAVTDVNGEFSIGELPAGTYQLTIDHPDYTGYLTDLNMPNVDKQVVLSLDGFEIPTDNFNFRVIVTTPDGLSNTPVVGALVEIGPGGYSGTTNDAGIVDFNIPGGFYSVTTSAPGYTNYSMDLTLDVDKQVVHSLQPIVEESPVPLYDLTGIVTDPNGFSNTGIPGVVLTAEPGGHVAVTDANGRFGFMNLPTGVYTLTLTKPGFSAPQMDLRMDGDKFVVLSMTPGSMD